VYEELGERRRAQAELEKLCAESPHYEDVAARLARMVPPAGPGVGKAA